MCGRDTWSYLKTYKWEAACGPLKICPKKDFSIFRSKCYHLQQTHQHSQKTLRILRLTARLHTSSNSSFQSGPSDLVCVYNVDSFGHNWLLFWSHDGIQKAWLDNSSTTAPAGCERSKMQTCRCSAWILEGDKYVPVYLVYCKQLVNVSGAVDGKVMCKHWMLVVAYSIFAFVYGCNRVCRLHLSREQTDQPFSNCLCLMIRNSQHAVVPCSTHSNVSKTWVHCENTSSISNCTTAWGQ